MVPSKKFIALILNPATTAVGLALYYKKNIKPYLASIAKGVSLLIKGVDGLAKSCPNTPMVLAGYSQGAMVVHEAELELLKNSTVT